MQKKRFVAPERKIRTTRINIKRLGIKRKKCKEIADFYTSV